MAPRTQHSDAGKRKRPADTQVAGKKDDGKKTADSANKRVKSSTDDKSAPAKKPFSNALPVAPLAVSKLKAPGKEEIVFPRGGGSVLTPLEFKEVANQALKDVLFETGAGGGSKGVDRGVDSDVEMGGEEKKVKQKKRKTEHSKKGKKEDTQTKEEDIGPKVEGLSFKVGASSMLIIRENTNIYLRGLFLELLYLVAFLKLILLTSQYPYRTTWSDMFPSRISQKSSPS